jgi:hypothetical protein
MTTAGHSAAATPPLQPSEEKPRIKPVARDDEDLTPTMNNRNPQRAPSEEEKPRTKRVAVVAAAAEEELVEQVEAPSSLRPEEKRRIKELARNVVHDPDGHLTEKVLLRLLRISRNRRRWGFLSPDHPVHAYYLQQKDIERCRMLRSDHAAAGIR